MWISFHPRIVFIGRKPFLGTTEVVTDLFDLVDKDCSTLIIFSLKSEIREPKEQGSPLTEINQCSILSLQLGQQGTWKILSHITPKEAESRKRVNSCFFSTTDCYYVVALHDIKKKKASELTPNSYK